MKITPESIKAGSNLFRVHRQSAINKKKYPSPDIIPRMSLSREEVEHIALLARLNLSEEELERYRQQLSSILDHFAKLQSLDTDDVPGLSSVLAESLTLRTDQAGRSLETQEVLANAPAQAADQFRVPPVLENDVD